jgi:apolipoprotein N-acyltransferase
MIDGYGRILAAAPLNSEAALDSPLPPRGPETLVLRFGHWPALLLLASLGGVILCFGEKRRSEGCRIA